MNQHQLACAKYFEVTHRAPLMSGVTHPNQYFEESMKILGDGKTDSSGTRSAANTNTQAAATASREWKLYLD